MSDLSHRAAPVPVPLPGREPAAGLVRFERDDGGEEGAGRALSPRQERFCRAFVTSNNGAAAAREAGYAVTAARQQAHRLLRRPAVRRRLHQLQRGLAQDTCLDSMVLMAKLEAIFRNALEYHHFHAATRAVEIQGRLAGHLAPGRLIAVQNDDK